MKFILFYAIFLVIFEITFASRILFLFPTPSKSHLMVVQGLSTTLAQRGHDVTVISPFPLVKPMKNYRDIKSPISGENDELKKDMVKNPNQSKLKAVPKFLIVVNDMSRQMMNMPEYKKIMKEEKFDLVIVGAFFNEYLLGVGDHFKCPTMMLSVAGAFTVTKLLVANPLGVSAVPHMINGAPRRMNFVDRTKNILFTTLDLAFSGYFYYNQKQIYDEFFPADRYISYDEALRNLSMVLVNCHVSQAAVQPYVPAIVEVGGLQIKPSPDPLPDDIQKWLDGAKDGAIFFSLGSNAKTTFLPPEKLEIILNVFSKLKQRVIMKWESDTLDRKSDNVLIGKWLPQDDILAHKNIKLFISHCGLGSIVEAKYHGVPIVGIAVFGDQIANIDSAVDEGWGVKVDFTTITEKSLLDGINEVLSNSKYAETVNRTTQLYRDRPMSARETAAYWVEYVIRHRGAPHLQYPGVHLNFWQRNSLDVIAFLIAAIYVFFKLVIIIIKFIAAKICKKPVKANEKIKRN